MKKEPCDANAYKIIFLTHPADIHTCVNQQSYMDVKINRKKRVASSRWNDKSLNLNFCIHLSICIASETEYCVGFLCHFHSKNKSLFRAHRGFLFSTSLIPLFAAKIISQLLPVTVITTATMTTSIVDGREGEKLLMFQWNSLLLFVICSLAFGITHHTPYL